MTVQTSMWLFTQNCNIDGINPTFNENQNWTTGILTLGGSKTIQKRTIAGLNLFSEAPSEGRVLKSSDTVLTAELWADCPSITGTSGFTVDVNRIVREDWSYTQATWNIYKTANNWGTAGADKNTDPNMDYSTPFASFASPTATGYQKITDQLVGLVNDAITAGGGRTPGLLLMRFKANSEAASDHIFSLYSDPDVPSRQNARLIVTYESPQPGPTLMGLSPGIM